MTETTTKPVKIATAEQAVALTNREGISFRLIGLESVFLVAYAGSLVEHRGPCWHVGWCNCEPCSTWTGEGSCDQRVLVTLDAVTLLHVGSSSFTVLDVEDDQVPAIVRFCAGCNAEAGEECRYGCLASEAE